MLKISAFCLGNFQQRPLIINILLDLRMSVLCLCLCASENQPLDLIALQLRQDQIKLKRLKLYSVKAVDGFQSFHIRSAIDRSTDFVSLRCNLSAAREC